MKWLLESYFVKQNTCNLGIVNNSTVKEVISSHQIILKNLKDDMME